MHDIQNKVLVYDIKKKKPKIVKNIFAWFKIMIYFQDKIKKLA
jgi:hypothetical protein